MKDYNGTNFNYKREEGLSGSPLYLMSGSSCSVGRKFLSSVDEPNQKLSLNLLIIALILSTLMKYMNFSQWLREISERLELELSKLEGT